MNRRPLVNTRDEPHADSTRFRRFHVIIGDANMSEFACALKIGTTSLVLDLIEQGGAPALELAQPIEATKAISRDSSYAWIVELQDGRKISAVEIQRLYLAAARRIHPQPEGEIRWVLDEWERVLTDLDRDVMLCRDRCDWVAKKFLLDTFRAEEGVEADHPWLQSLDLEYHNVDIDDGLHHALVRDGQMRRFLTEEDVRNAIFMPPETTRAFFRGRAVARYQPEIASIHWDEVVFQHRGERHPISLNQAFNDEELSRLNGLMGKARSLGELLESLERRDP